MTLMYCAGIAPLLATTQLYIWHSIMLFPNEHVHRGRNADASTSVSKHTDHRRNGTPSKCHTTFDGLLGCHILSLGRRHKSAYVPRCFDIGTVATFCVDPADNKALFTVMRCVPRMVFWIQNFKDELCCSVTQKAIAIHSPPFYSLGVCQCGVTLGKAARCVLHSIANHPILHSFQFCNRRCDNKDTSKSPYLEWPAF